MGQLDGRVIIVTGAAQGIGAIYAKRLAQEGARVVACDVQDAEPVAAAIRQDGAEAVSAITDVTDANAVGKLVTDTEAAFGGRIDGLLNNAALFTALGHRPFEEIDADEFDRVMQVNVRGVWEVTRAVAPVMRRQKYGKIVNIASTTLYKGTPNMLHYVVSKGAVVAMSRVMAKELGGDNICVNTLAPGLTQTDDIIGAGQYTDDYFTTNASARVFKRVQTPDDLVGTAVFLMSAASDFVTGQSLVVDGGAVFN